MRLLFLTNVPSPYRIDFFNELGKKTELTVLFEKRTSDERDNSWSNYQCDSFQGLVLKGIKISDDKALCFSVLKYLPLKWDCIIVTNAFTPTGILAIQYMKNKGISYWIEGDGAFAKNGKGLKEKFKKYILSGAAGYFSSSKEHDNYYLRYGAEKRKIHRFPFTSLYQRDILSVPISVQEKKRIKRKLGIKENKVILAVGQFIFRKGFDLLIQAAEKIDSNVAVIIVGNKPTEEYLLLKEKLNLKNVYFEQFMKKDELSQYYLAADLFVLPTREDIWGLVINEAMGYGLPIITTDKCISGLELVDDSNGRIIQANSFEAVQLAINELIRNDDLLLNMSRSSLAKISKYTYENMVAVHLRAIQGEYQ